jgi:hypothetical protein
MEEKIIYKVDIKNMFIAGVFIQLGMFAGQKIIDVVNNHITFNK